MPRLSHLSIALLPLALCATAAAAQEAGPTPPERPQRMGPPVQHAPREAPQRMQQPRPEADMARRAERPMPSMPSMQQQPDRRSMSNAVRQVKRSTGGQILGAEQVPYEGRNITRVKYMDDRGRVRYMDMDESGSSERRAPRRTDNGEP